MSLQHRFPDQVRADPWTLFCAECAKKMRITTAIPAQGERETRRYECACGHSERIELAIQLWAPRGGSVTSSQPPYHLLSHATSQPLQSTPHDRLTMPDRISTMKMIAAPLLRPRPTTRLSTVQTPECRANPPQPSVRDGMLAIVPSLRAFAISLSGKLDRADDLVQETLLRALANINSFRPGSNMSAWLFTILRNLFRSEYRKRRREVEDADGGYLDSLKSPPEQYSRLEFEEFRAALATLPPDQREALLLVGASGFSYDEAAAICETAVGTIKSRVNRARTRLSELLAVEGADKFGPDHATLAILTADARPRSDGH